MNKTDQTKITKLYENSIKRGPITLPDNFGMPPKSKPQPARAPARSPFKAKLIARLEDAAIDEDGPLFTILDAMQGDGVMDTVDFEVAAIAALQAAGHPQVEDLSIDDIRDLIGAGLNMKLEEVGDRIEMSAYLDEDNLDDAL
jgi:hypothetical protein